MSFLDDAGVTKLTSYLKGKIQMLLSKKQDTLISGTNIKSINGNSMLGSGNIAIKGSSWYGTSSTAATTATKSVTCGGYVLQTGGGTLVCVTFSTANTYVSGALKLNVNSTGAKNIYVNNAVTSASNTLTWDAGECLTFVYSGSYYYFVGRSKAGGSTVDEWIDISESFEDDQGSSVGIYAITNGKFVYFSYNASADGASTDVSGFTVLDDKYIPSRPYCGAGSDNNGLPLVGYFDYNNLSTIMTSSTESLPCFLLTIFYPINL